jgi:PAS domain S-box-containing protein
LDPSDFGIGRLFWNIHEAIVLAEAVTGHIALWNPSAERLFGHPKDEIVGRSIEVLIPEQLRPLHREGLARFAQTGQGRWIETHRPIELPALHNSGHEITVELTLHTIHDLPFPGRFVLAVIRDVSERKSLEELQLRQARYLILNADVRAALGEGGTLGGMLQRCTEALVHQIDAAIARIWTIDDADDVLELQASAGLYTQLEGPHGRVPVGRSEIVQIAQERMAYRTNRVVGDPRVSDQEWARREGMVAFAGYPLLVGGRLVGVMAIFARRPLADDAHETLEVMAEAVAQGIERRRVEEALSRGSRWNKLILETAGEGIYGLDRQGRVSFANPAAARMLGFTAEELVGQKVHELVHHSPSDGSPNPFEACPLCAPLQDGLARQGPDELLWRADGTSFPVEYTSTPILEEDQIAGLVVTFQDITERLRTEQALARRAAELARSNAELEQFAYVASHDLQEPLRAVVSYVQLLEKRYRGQLDARADKYIAYAVDGARRMQTLINDLLAFSRVDRQGQSPAPIETETMLGLALANLRLAIEESEASVTHGPLPVVVADRTQLLQLFQNLVGNALKFRGEDAPRIHVRAERGEGEWRFAVEDNGIGIAPDYQERIFLLFQRLHGRTEYPGTGIGLAICKKIVERHGGRIWVESTGSSGSTFYFTIPDQDGGTAP